MNCLISLFIGAAIKIAVSVNRYKTLNVIMLMICNFKDVLKGLTLDFVLLVSQTCSWST